ncbi:hypothetical protein Tco_0826973 [Tanacetum coccineum]
MQEVILFYNGLGIPTRQILNSRDAIPSKTAADAKVAIQEMAEYSQKWHNGTSRSRSTKTSDGLAAIQAQLNNLGREIKKVNEKVYAAQVGCEQCKGPYNTKDCPLKEEGKTLEEAYYMQFGRPFQGGGYRAAAPGFYQRNNVNPSKLMFMPLSTYLNLGLGELAHTKLTVELANKTMKYPKGIAENMLVGIGKFVFPIDFIILDMPEDIKEKSGDDLMPTIKEGAANEWFTKECIGSIITWDNMVEKFILKFHHLSDHDEEEETEEDDNPNETDNVPEIFKIEGNLFDFETPLCEAFYEFKYLLKSTQICHL